MNLQCLITVFQLIVISRGEITKFLREYIESKNRLQQYSVTTFVDYEKNRSRVLEENLFLNLKGYVSVKDSVKLKNMILNVSVFELENHEFDCKIIKNQNQTNISGYSVDLLKSLQNVLQFQINYKIIDNINGSNLTEQILLKDNTSNLIICHPDINISLTEILYPTLESRYVLIYKLNKLSFTEDIFILTFAGTLWLCFIIILILLAISLRIATKQYNRIYGHPQWDSVEITFWAIATACQQGLTSIPYGFASRLIIFLGAITAYLLYTGFAAGITSLVAVQNQNFEITIEDIKKMKLKVVAFGNLNSLPFNYNYLLDKAWYASNLKILFKQLDEKNWIGITLQLYLNQYLQENLGILDRCDYMMTVIKDSKHKMSNLVPKYSNLRKIFNYWYTRSRDHGLFNPSLTEELLSCAGTSSGGGGYSSARLEHVRSAILLLMFGLAISTIFALGECIWYGYLYRKSRRQQNTRT